MKFSLQFFAAITLADVKKSTFVIITRKYDDNTELRHPGIAVKGLKNYVFDITEAQFIKLGRREDSTTSAIDVAVCRDDKDFIFVGVPELRYPQEEFFKTYSNRVINDSLFE